MVNFEGAQHEVFFQVHPGYESIKFDLFNYAEEINVKGISKSTGRIIRAVYINDFDAELIQFVEHQVYEKWEHFSQENSSMSLEEPLQEIALPEGYRLQSLADENDLHKINRVLWRGLITLDRLLRRKSPGVNSASKRLISEKIWLPWLSRQMGITFPTAGRGILRKTRLPYVEPVATDPDFRRMGLGRAAVLESVRKAAAGEGAEIAWVGSARPFYSAIGFEKKFAVIPWVKYLD